MHLRTGLLISLNSLLVLDLVGQLGQLSGALLALLSEAHLRLLQVEGGLSTLQLAKLRVVHFVLVQKDFLSGLETGCFDEQVDVRALLQLETLIVVDHLALKVDSQDALLAVLT